MPETSPNPVNAVTTSPCPGCGRPVAAGAVICTQCGQRVGKEDQVATKVGRSAPGPAPVPGIAPGPARFRRPQEDPRAAAEMLKLVIVLSAGVAGVVLWKGLENGPGEAANYLVRFGISAACAVGVLAMMAAMVIDVSVAPKVAILGVVAAVAGGDLVQHAVNHLPLLGILPWVAATLACILMLSDFLDLEMHDAVFLGLPIYIVKWALKATLFEAMYGTMGTAAAG